MVVVAVGGGAVVVVLHIFILALTSTYVIIDKFVVVIIVIHVITPLKSSAQPRHLMISARISGLVMSVIPSCMIGAG